MMLALHLYLRMSCCFLRRKAYIWTVIFTGLFISIVLVNKGVNSKGTNKIALSGLLLLEIGIIGTLSWSSHASSNFGIIGFGHNFTFVFRKRLGRNSGCCWLVYK